MVDAAPRDVGDVQQAIDAAEINERTVIGDVLDDALEHLTLFQALDEIGALFGAGFLENGTARDNDVAAALVHLEDLERLRGAHERADVADRADIHLAARQEGNGAVEVDGVAALDLVEDGAFDLLVGLEGLLQTHPRMLAAGLFARQDGFAERVLDALEVNFDLIARLQGAVDALGAELAQRHAAFGLQANVDDGEVLLDRNDTAVDDRAFGEGIGVEALFEHCREIVAGRIGLSCSHDGLDLLTSAADTTPASIRPLACIPCNGFRAIRTPVFTLPLAASRQPAACGLPDLEARSAGLAFVSHRLKPHGKHFEGTAETAPFHANGAFKKPPSVRLIAVKGLKSLFSGPFGDIHRRAPDYPPVPGHTASMIDTAARNAASISISVVSSK